MQPPYDPNRSPYAPTAPVDSASAQPTNPNQYPNEPYYQQQYPPQAQPPYGYQQPYPPQYPPQAYGYQQPVAYGTMSPYAVPQGDPNATGRWKRWFGFNIIALYIALAVLVFAAQIVFSSVLAEVIATDDPAVLLQQWNAIGWLVLGFGGAIAGVLLAFLHKGALHHAVENKQLWFGVTILGSAIAFPLVMYVYVQMLISGFQAENGATVFFAHVIAGCLAAVCIGVPQMFVIRQRVRDAWQWVAVMAATWTLFMAGTIGLLLTAIATSGI